MRSLFIVAVLALVIVLIPVAVSAQDVYFNAPLQAELTEGQTYSVEWLAGGAETVDILICGTRTPLGGRPRGDFEIPAATKVTAVQGVQTITIPWIDSLKFFIRIISRDGAGKKVSSAQREFRFRPAVLADRPDDGIYVDLHQKTNQRLFVESGGVITKACICSSSMNYSWMPPNVHPKTPHDHAGVYKVISRQRTAYSKLYEVEMPWALQYLSGHFIHATSPPLYKLLGRPASHGCNRLTREDAHALFDATPLGARVEIIGPGK